MAGTELATAFVQIIPTAKNIQSELTSLLSGDAEKAGSTAGETTGKSFMSKFGSALAGGAVAVAGAATTAVGTIVSGTKELAAYGDNIDKMSQKMGISATAFQEWDAILQHSGTSIEAMKPAFKNLATLAEGNAEAFEAVGLSQKQVASMSAEELFAATISGLQGMEEGAERTALATQLLGKAGMDLGPLLNTSAEDTEAMRQAVHDLGGILSDDAVKNAAAFQDSMQDMNTAIDGLKNNMLAQFLPSMTDVMSGLTALFAGDSEEGIGMIRTGIESVGQGIMESLPTIMETVTSLATSMLQMLVENLPAFLDVGIQVISSLISGIAANLPALLTSMASAIISMVGEIITHLPEILSAGVELIGSLIDGIMQAGPGILSSIGDLISQAWDAIINFDWLGAGKAIIDGIISGITNFGGSLLGSIGNLASRALGGFKKVLGISSPSKVFRDEVGRFIPEGIAVGIEANTDSVTDAVRSLSDMTVSAYDATFNVPAVKNREQFNVDIIVDEVRKLKDAITGMQLVLDTGATVGGLAPAMDTELGSYSVYRGRGN